MTKIALVVSDVDGTLVTHDKRLTDKAKAAVKKLEDNGIAFTITSSRSASRCRSGRSMAHRWWMVISSRWCSI